MASCPDFPLWARARRLEARNWQQSTGQCAERPPPVPLESSPAVLPAILSGDAALEYLEVEHGEEKPAGKRQLDLGRKAGYGRNIAAIRVLTQENPIDMKNTPGRSLEL
jgi:hypothetical protein